MNAYVCGAPIIPVYFCASEIGSAWLTLEHACIHVLVWNVSWHFNLTADHAQCPCKWHSFGFHSQQLLDGTALLCIAPWLLFIISKDLHMPSVQSRSLFEESCHFNDEEVLMTGMFRSASFNMLANPPLPVLPLSSLIGQRSQS